MLGSGGREGLRAGEGRKAMASLGAFVTVYAPVWHAARTHPHAHTQNAHVCTRARSWAQLLADRLEHVRQSSMPSSAPAEGGGRLRVVSYNLLADVYATSTLARTRCALFSVHCLRALFFAHCLPVYAASSATSSTSSSLTCTPPLSRPANGVLFFRTCLSWPIDDVQRPPPLRAGLPIITTTSAPCHSRTQSEPSSHGVRCDTPAHTP